MEKKDIKNNKGLVTILVILVVLLSGGLGVLGYFYYDLKQKNAQTEVVLIETTGEKEKVQGELEELLSQYEALETDNEEVKSELEAEKQKIATLIEEIKKVKSNNAWQVSQYKKELETLRKIMKGYISTIDSLNTLAETYKYKYTEAKSDFEASKKTITTLSEEKTALTEAVDKASVLSAINISASPLNSKGKPTTKIKKLEKLQVCFTIRENITAKPGPRFIYLRIARPDSLVIINTAENIFTYEGNPIAFTERRELDYQNRDTSLCIYWKKNQELMEGIYTADLFADGKKIGRASFELK